MADEIVTDAKTVLADTKAKIASLDTSAKADLTKVKAFWADYKFYLVAAVILIVGLVAGYHLHK